MMVYQESLGKRIFIKNCFFDLKFHFDQLIITKKRII